MVRLQSCCRPLGRRRIGRAVRPRIRLRGCMRLLILGVLLPFCFGVVGVAAFCARVLRLTDAAQFGGIDRGCRFDVAGVACGFGVWPICG